MRELLRDFYKIARIRVGFFNPDGLELMAYPEQVSPCCQAVRDNPAGYQACMKCDWNAYRQAAENKAYHIYQCHAGLTEMIVPIHGNGVIVGYLMMGQFCSEETWETGMENRTATLRNLGIAEQQLKPFFEALPVLDMESIFAYARILQACAAYVWMDGYIRMQETSLGKRVERYLMNHLEQKITLADLTEEFEIGKTTLCSAVKAEFGLTVSELMRCIRMGKAKHQLQAGTLTISEIARGIGMEDYNYFSKVFRQETGCTPSAYRKQWESDSPTCI